MTAAAGGAGTSVWAGLAEARALAAGQGNRRVGTQHLLLVLLSGADDETRTTLRGAGVDESAVEAALGAILGSGGPPRRTRSDHEVELSERVVAVLADARARGSGNSRGAITDHDLLVALMNADDLSVARLIVSYIGARRRVLDRLDRAQVTL